MKNFPTRSLLLALPLLITAPLAFAGKAKPALDLPALIECRGSTSDFLNLAMDKKPGWKPVPETNMFMAEYTLPAPISVFTYKTQRVAFTASGIVAVLDLSDPHPLAAQLEMKPFVDTPQKVMFTKQISNKKERDEKIRAIRSESVTLNVSTVTTHPGKTLAGCEYRMDVRFDDE
jgi:hypothetical protein